MPAKGGNGSALPLLLQAVDGAGSVKNDPVTRTRMKLDLLIISLDAVCVGPLAASSTFH